MKPEDAAEELFKGIAQEINLVEKLAKIEDAVSLNFSSSKQGEEKVPCEHVRILDPNQNPVFSADIEFAKLKPDQKFETLNPSQFLFLPEIEKDTLLAIRNHKKRADLVPGENVSSRTHPGEERYYAKVRGRLLVIGSVIHILPSDMDGKLSTKVAQGGLLAFLDITPPFGRGNLPDLPATLAYLQKHNIHRGFLENSIAKALEFCRHMGKPISNLLAAKGYPPMEGKAGSIEYFFDKDFQGPHNLDFDDAGKINFRNVKWIPMVAEDQLLARITPSILGSEGIDVSGRVLPAKPIPKVYLIAGPGTRVENGGTEFYSDISGYVQMNGSQLDVMNVFVLQSDVDYHSGNLHFDGNIMITGSVRKGFEVEARGDVVILGNVEPCRIKAGRDIHVKGGILGAGKGAFGLEAGRNILAEYTENASLEAHGDILIENYALQSFLSCSGRILLEKKKGALIGGVSMAGKSIETKSLGSTTGIKTHVAASVDYTLKRQQASLRTRADEIKASIEKIDRFLRSLLELRKQGALHPSKAQALKHIVEKRTQISKTLEAILLQHQECESLQESLEPGFIKATEVAYPEVVITIRNRSMKLDKSCFRGLFRLDEKSDLIVRGTA